MYTCEFVGNVSCLQTPAELSNLGYYSFCKNAPAVYGSLNASVAMVSFFGFLLQSTSYVGILDSGVFACDTYGFGEWIADFGFLANEASDGH